MSYKENPFGFQTRYEAFHFPNELSRFKAIGGKEYKEPTYLLRSKIYNLMHLGYDRDKIEKLLNLKNRGHLSKLMNDSFDFYPSEIEFHKKRLTNINAGLKLIRSNPTSLTSMPETITKSHQSKINGEQYSAKKKLEIKKKFLLLDLNGFSKKYVSEKLSFGITLVSTFTNRLKSEILSSIELENTDFQSPAIFYANLIGLYANGHLNFGIESEMKDFSVSLAGTGRKILTSDEVANIIEMQES